jgi:hypothetical protein
MGMTPSSAMRHHENKLLLQEQKDGKISTDDSSLNPKKDSVAHLHKEWKKKEFGVEDGSSPLNNLKDRLKELHSKGTCTCTELLFVLYIYFMYHI